jgi:hypothetical protein
MRRLPFAAAIAALVAAPVAAAETTRFGTKAEFVDMPLVSPLSARARSAERSVGGGTGWPRTDPDLRPVDFSCPRSAPPRR